jgi:hypothetical protein
MKKINTLKLVGCLQAVFLAAPGDSDASLVAVNGLVYDSDRNITFLQDSNLALTQTFGVSGITGSGYMSWNTANSYIAAMNAANYLGFNSWRLPHSSDNPGYSQNSALDEMSHLYYSELGGAPAGGLGTVGPFLNLPTDVWSDHTASWNSGTAFFFSFGATITPGYQTAGWKNGEFGTQYAVWAVLDGDATPEPSRFVLLGCGLGGLMLRRRRK